MVRGGIVYVALEELLVLLLLLEQTVNTVAAISCHLLSSPASDGGQTWPRVLTSPAIRQVLSDNTGESKIIQ